jgi:6-pyruvoyltetrahydropterin/6-carboxytetrahydropterin synthase
MFKFENAHVVRNCYSERCKYSIHGHSYEIEILFKSRKLDKAGMVLDFGIMKQGIKDVIDSWDHSTQFWDKDDPEYIAAIKKFSARWISLPVSPSAEQMSRVFFVLVDEFLSKSEFHNGEDENIILHSVVVHETRTGYAECFKDDAYNDFDNGAIKISDIVFSDAIRDEWSDRDMMKNLLNGDSIVYKEPEQQV